MKFGTIKKYYGLGLFSDEDLALFVTVGFLSAEQLQEIKAEE